MEPKHMNRESAARGVAIGLAVAGLFFFASMANAAPVPEGSYQQSCRNFAANHGMLSAECKSRNGEWANTQLDEYRGCTGDISNNNGQLTCQKGSAAAGGTGPSGQPTGTGGQGSGAPGGQGPGTTAGQGQSGTGGQGPAATGGQGQSGTGGQGTGAPGHGDDHTGDRTRHDGDNGGGTPQGSYGDTCRNAHIDGDTLVAECRTSGGDWRRTSLDNYRQCRGDIANNDGGLRCQRGDEGRGGRGNEDRGDGGPQGSYRDSCRNIHIDGNDLVAECRTRDGDWRRTSLDNYRECRGDISNDDGRLRCQRADEDRGGRGSDDRGGYGGGYEPPGSYAQTCRNIRAEHGDLEADCRTRYGEWRHSSLDNFRDCRGDIANDNGRLVCSSGGGYGYGRITLYVDSKYRGGRRSYDTDAPDLGDFSDTASSAYIQGGVWQLCTRRYYRGRCVTLNHNVSNFLSYGINDRIESLRRVR